MLASLKLYAFLGALTVAFFLGGALVHFYHGNKEKKELKRAIAEQQKQAKKDAALDQALAQSVDAIRESNIVYVEKVKTIEKRTCPRLPADYVRLFNDATKAPSSR